MHLLGHGSLLLAGQRIPGSSGRTAPAIDGRSAFGGLRRLASRVCIDRKLFRFDPGQGSHATGTVFIAAIPLAGYSAANRMRVCIFVSPHGYGRAKPENCSIRAAKTAFSGAGIRACFGIARLPDVSRSLRETVHNGMSGPLSRVARRITQSHAEHHESRAVQGPAGRAGNRAGRGRSRRRRDAVPARSHPGKEPVHDFRRRSRSPRGNGARRCGSWSDAQPAEKGPGH